MQHITYHRFLVQASGPQQARDNITRFLDRTTLIKYSAVQFNDSLSFSAADDSFWDELEKGLTENKEAVAAFCRELRTQGYEGIEDLQNMPQGFESKTLHTLVHLLDGFIGVDSCLYNLVEDSHWVSPSLRETIKKQPDQYHLVYIDVGEIRMTVFHDTP